MLADQDEFPINPTALEHEAYGWVVRFVSGQGGPADLAALKEWSARSPAHTEAFDRARRVWKALDPARRQALFGKTVSHKALSDNILPLSAAAAGRRTVPRPGRRAFLGGAIAASAAGAAYLAVRPPLELWPSLSELSADYRTSTGEQRQIALANGVSVAMNTQTSIAVRASDGAAQRFELISGEALVVAPKSPVTVLAAGGRVTASDARFNVRHLGTPVCVTCLDGVVEVAIPAKVVTLAAGRQVIYSGDGVDGPDPIDPGIVTAWKNGVIVFDNTPISEVIAEINRYRHGKVILTRAALGRERFNARFRIENIDRVVDQIAQVFGVRPRNLPGGIVLLG